MDVLPDVVRWVGVALGWLLLVMAGVGALTIVIAVVRAAVDAVRARRRRRGTAPSPPAWHLSLLVEVDEQAGLVRPSVQVRGPGVGQRASVRVELVGPEDVERVVLGRDFPAAALDRDLALPSFTPPPDIRLDEVLGCTWRVVLEDASGELARWLEHPRPAAGLTKEAEVRLTGVPEHRAPSEAEVEAEQLRRLIDASLASDRGRRSSL